MRTQVAVREPTRVGVAEALAALAVAGVRELIPVEAVEAVPVVGEVRELTLVEAAVALGPVPLYKDHVLKLRAAKRRHARTTSVAVGQEKPAKKTENAVPG